MLINGDSNKRSASFFKGIFEANKLISDYFNTTILLLLLDKRDF